jgi:hemerythrin superfamily protein
MAIDFIQLPVHGSTAIEILKHDHRTIARLLTVLTLATTRDERSDALTHLKAALVVHNATEENIVYPALRAIAGKMAESKQLYHETAEADVLIFELDVMLENGADAEFDATVKELQTAVVAHVATEENSAFPDLEAHANAQEIVALGLSVREFRNSFQFKPSK